MIAFIPARAGSQRVPGKNTRLLNGYPLIAYSIAAAQQSGLFDCVIVSSDDEQVFNYVCCSARSATWCEASYFDRPPVSDDQADIVWVRDAVQKYWTATSEHPDSFAILRPTSPFRTAATIQRAHALFTAADETCDSIRAVEPVTQHPYKMWTWPGDGYPIKPLHDGTHPDGTPWHSSPTQSLPRIYVQNSSLEMGYTSNVEVHGTIHGRKVIPFFTRMREGFSIDTEDDWTQAVRMAAACPEWLPRIEAHV